MSLGILFLGAKEMQGLKYSMPDLLNNKHDSIYQKPNTCNHNLMSLIRNLRRQEPQMIPNTLRIFIYL